VCNSSHSTQSSGKLQHVMRRYRAALTISSFAAARKTCFSEFKASRSAFSCCWPSSFTISACLALATPLTSSFDTTVKWIATMCALVSEVEETLYDGHCLQYHNIRSFSARLGSTNGIFLHEKDHILSARRLVWQLLRARSLELG
jgi:hypothetical protein